MSPEPFDETVTPDLDTLFSDEVNAAQVDQIIKDGLPPQGSYQTNPDEYEVNSFINMQDEKNAEGAVTGQRRVITFVGIATGRFDGDEVNARMRFRISPDARKKRDWETKELTEKDDLMTRLYAQAVKAYESTTGAKPKRNTDLIDWLKTSSIKVRTFNTDSGESLVIGITPVGRGARR